GTRAVGWGEAIAFLTERGQSLRGAPVQAVISPFACNEDAAALVELIRQLGGGELSYRLERAPDEAVLKGFPTLVRRRDLAPNVLGVAMLGASRVGQDDGTGGLDEMVGSHGVI